MEAYSIDLKGALLALLDDSAVQSKLRAILSSEQAESSACNEKVQLLEARVAELTAQLDDKETKIAEYEAILRAKDNELAQLTFHVQVKAGEIGERDAELEKNKRQITELTTALDAKETGVREKERKITELESQLAGKVAELEAKERELAKYGEYEDLISLWNELLESCSPETLSYLDGLCGDRALASYLGIGTYWNKVKQLYGYLKDVAMRCEATSPELAALSKYYDLIMGVYMLANKSEGLRKVEVAIGGVYDSQAHIKTRGSTNTGRVRAVLVNGYVNDRNKYVFNPIVTVHD